MRFASALSLACAMAACGPAHAAPAVDPVKTLGFAIVDLPFSQAKNADDFLVGLFLVRVDRANYRWHPQKPYFSIRFTVLEPKELSSRSIEVRIYCTPKALWRLNWFLRDFAYDTDLLGRDEVDEKALIGLKGVIRTSRKTLAGRCFLNLDGFAPAAEWEIASGGTAASTNAKEGSDDLQLHAD